MDSGCFLSQEYQTRRCKKQIWNEIPPSRRRAIHSHGRTPAARQAPQQFNQKRTSIEKEMADQVTGRVKSVASKRGLSLVVDKAAVIYGGTDITKDVSDSLAKSTSASADAAKTDAAKTDSSTTK